jgi:hypothetical protein
MTRPAAEQTHTPRPELPPQLYDEIREPDGGGTRLVCAADRLVAWSERDRGDSVRNWCKAICERDIAAIDAWEDARILHLEDEWTSAERDVEDEDNDEHEQRYHLACDAVVQEASRKRNAARKQMTANAAAIEALVRNAREHIEEHTPPPQEHHFAGYFLVIAVLAAMAWILLA